MRRCILVVVLLAAVFACLPDLDALAPAPEVPPPGCGDRFIDPDAGETCDPGDAGGSGCTRCKVDCPDSGFVDPVSGHCYFVLTSTSSFKVARDGCENNGHLLTLTSEREARVVDEKVARGVVYWIDLTQDEAQRGYVPKSVFEPGFPAADNDAGCPGCFVRGPLSGTGACVSGGIGSWVLTNCSGGQSFGVVCEREPSGQRTSSCNGPYCATVVATTGQKRYLLFINELSADDAVKTCNSFKGGRLVVLDSEDEREQLVAELRGLDTVSLPIDVWIGLSFDGTRWKWEDGVGVDEGARPVPWGLAQPAAATAGNRATLRVVDSNIVDTHLAQNADAGLPDGGPASHAFICERDP